MFRYDDVVPPSTQYVASVKGAPTKPSTAASVPASSARSALSAAPAYGTASAGTSGRMPFTASMERMGVETTGPSFSRMSNGTPRPVSGVRMSENMMTPSGLNALWEQAR
jgi:hypothetical protein